MPLKGQIASIEGERVTLVLEDGQKITLPVSAVEGSLQAGAEAAIIVVPVGAEDAGRSELARQLLNELLRP